ncbi:MAG: hypothetical protein ISR77_31690 [Pirellulaceae bacterium]|nr:hypothetical protein [Pirellulaceae bacterium]
MNSADREELDWLAFRYVADELASDEVSDFEGRLAHDQTARDAVSRAVELTNAIRAAEEAKPVTLSPARRSRLQRPLRLVACLSTCVLVAVVCHWLLRHDESTSTDVSERPSTAAAELALVWSETRLELADQQGDAWALLQVTDSGELPVAAEDTAAMSVPDWMFSAVVALEAHSESREEEDG